MKKPKKRNKPYVPKGRRLPMIIAARVIMSQIESILLQLEQEGTMTVSQRGTLVCKDMSDGKWFEAYPAMVELMDYFGMYETRHGVKLPLDAFREFTRGLPYNMPVTESLHERMKRDLVLIQRTMSHADPEDAHDLYVQTKIKIELANAAAR